MTTREKKIRLDAGLSQLKAAVLADVATNTWKLYESAPDAVSPRVRERCDAAIDQITETLRQKTGKAA